MKKLPVDYHSNKKTVRAVAFAHQCYDKYDNFLHYLALDGLNSYIVTAEQINEAKEIHEQNTKEAIKNTGTKLVFVGMGCDYTQISEGDPGNFRIRTEIINPDGRNFFIELCRGSGYVGNDFSMYFDHVTDRDQEMEYEEKRSFYREKIQEIGGFHKVGKDHPYFVNWNFYGNQPYFWYKCEQWQGQRVGYTFENILKYVNQLFDCHFTEVVINSNELTTDMYKSISPKNQFSNLYNY